MLRSENVQHSQQTRRRDAPGIFSNQLCGALHRWNIGCGCPSPTSVRLITSLAAGEELLFSNGPQNAARKNLELRRSSSRSCAAALRAARQTVVFWPCPPPRSDCGDGRRRTAGECWELTATRKEHLFSQHCWSYHTGTPVRVLALSNWLRVKVLHQRTDLAKPAFTHSLAATTPPAHPSRWCCSCNLWDLPQRFHQSTVLEPPSVRRARALGKRVVWAEWSGGLGRLLPAVFHGLLPSLTRFSGTRSHWRK